jgi:hypothetical protein
VEEKAIPGLLVLAKGQSARKAPTPGTSKLSARLNSISTARSLNQQPGKGEKHPWSSTA